MSQVAAINGNGNGIDVSAIQVAQASRSSDLQVDGSHVAKVAQSTPITGNAIDVAKQAIGEPGKFADFTG